VNIQHSPVVCIEYIANTINGMQRVLIRRFIFYTVVAK